MVDIKLLIQGLSERTAVFRMSCSNSDKSSGVVMGFMTQTRNAALSEKVVWTI